MIYLHEPFIDKSDLKKVIECVKSGWVSSAGPMISKFEKKLSNYTGSKYVVACSNGTSALHLSLKLLNIDKNDEVLVPSLTFIAAVNSIIYNELSPFFIDIDKYYTIDNQKLLSFLKNKTKKTKYKNKNCLTNIKTGKRIRALVLVHTFGNAANIEPIYDFCKKNNIFIVEDAAESLGTFYNNGKFKNKHTGTIGIIGCLSFNGNKIITTGGGGAILTNYISIAEKARYYINQSKDDDIFHIHNEIGYNYKLNNIQASLGISQLNNINKILKIKKNIHLNYKDFFINISNLNISSTPGFCNSNNWLNILEVNKKINKKNLKKLILKLYRCGIQTRPLWYPNHLQKPFLKYGSDNINYLNNVYTNRLCLPSSPILTVKQIKFISSNICKYISNI
ncbi:MAG: aminotransferase DegT [Parcubacteria group bacterium]|jgi:perosamine synthetase|nr:aminotransferase DegT [Parcubacteria group bacterium]|tara:strand:+ start:375 stop:1553 length:1179 start_codon:yes stop_codon:yes gene_type:complete